MANVKISALPAATTVASADVLPIVQSATTKKATIQNVSDALGVTTTVANTSPGLVFIKSQVVGSAVSSVTVSDAFSSSYDHYKIIYSGGSASSTTDISMRLGSTSTGYFINMIFKDWGSGAVNGQGANGAAQWNYVGCEDTPNHVAIEVYNPYLSAKTGFSGNYLGIGSGRVGGVINGFLNDTNSYTAFTFYAGIGTITGGTIYVYGYRK